MELIKIDDGIYEASINGNIIEKMCKPIENGIIEKVCYNKKEAKKGN
jgi:hypothetical protein